MTMTATMSHARADDAPLNDPGYEPRYRPVNGKPHPVVARWGPRSQVRWFARFWSDMVLFRGDVEGLYCSSVEHTGSCCESCVEDVEMGYDAVEGHCCCRALRAVGGNP